MGEIMRLGLYWGYTEERCGGCEFLETSLPFSDGHRLYACDAKNGICIKDGDVVYKDAYDGTTQVPGRDY